MDQVSAGQRRRCRPTSRTTGKRFVSFSLVELLRLTPQDFDELDGFAGKPEGEAVWWELRRAQWIEEGAER